MDNERFEYLYRAVPKHQKDQLENFRKAHPALKVMINGIEWEYFFKFFFSNFFKENKLLQSHKLLNI